MTACKPNETSRGSETFITVAYKRTSQLIDRGRAAKRGLCLGGGRAAAAPLRASRRSTSFDAPGLRSMHRHPRRCNTELDACWAAALPAIIRVRSAARVCSSGAEQCSGRPEGVVAGQPAQNQALPARSAPPMKQAHSGMGSSFHHTPPAAIVCDVSGPHAARMGDTGARRCRRVLRAYLQHLRSSARLLRGRKQAST